VGGTACSREGSCLGQVECFYFFLLFDFLSSLRKYGGVVEKDSRKRIPEVYPGIQMERLENNLKILIVQNLSIHCMSLLDVRASSAPGLKTRK